MDYSVLIFIVTIILLVPGIIMAIVPGLPGLLFMLLIATIYGLFDHFTHLTLGNLGILALITAVAMLVDLFSGIIGAKWGGAHWSSIWYGLLGLVVGSIVIPIPIIGSLAGLFLGVLGAEWYRTSSIKKANKAAMGSFAGSIVGMVSNGVAALTFVILFGIFAWS
jgi:uncharacterized protein YqgC (DUF456 family)